MNWKICPLRQFAPRGQRGPGDFQYPPPLDSVLLFCHCPKKSTCPKWCHSKGQQLLNLDETYVGLTYWLPSSPPFPVSLWNCAVHSNNNTRPAANPPYIVHCSCHQNYIWLWLILSFLPLQKSNFFANYFQNFFQQCVLGKAFKIGLSSRVWSLSGFVNVSLNHRCCWEKEMSGVDLLFAEPIKSWVRPLWLWQCWSISTSFQVIIHGALAPKGRGQRKKNIFFRALPELPNPPSPWPQFGQLGPLFSEV